MLDMCRKVSCPCSWLVCSVCGFVRLAIGVFRVFQCGDAHVHEDGNLEDAAAENEVRVFLVFVDARIKSLYVPEY